MLLEKPLCLLNDLKKMQRFTDLGKKLEVIAVLSIKMLLLVLA